MITPPPIPSRLAQNPIAIAEKNSGTKVPTSMTTAHLRGQTIRDRVWSGVGAVPRVDRIHTER